MTKIDLIISAIIIISFVMGLCRGFIRTLFGCLGGIISFICASYIASRFSAEVSKKLIEPSLRQAVASSIKKSMPDASASKLWSEQSEYLRSLLRQTGFSEDTLSAASHPVKALSAAIASTVGHSIAYAALLCISFIICIILLHIISNALNFMSHLPILHSFNAILGGLLGAVFGIALCACVLWALKLFVPAIYSDYGALPPSEMRKSPLASALVGWNDGVSLFEIIPAE